MIGREGEGSRKHERRRRETKEREKEDAGEETGLVERIRL